MGSKAFEIKSDQLAIPAESRDFSMTGDALRWWIVAAGLYLKLLAMWGGVLSALIFTVFAQELPGWSALGLLLSIVCLDFIGRCLCLAAPVLSRIAIDSSVVCQAVGVILFAYLILEWERAMILLLPLAVCLQIFAAFTFTSFLRTVARTLDRTDLEAEVGLLYKKMAANIRTSATLGVYTFVVAVIALMITVLLCFVGWIIAIPFAVISLSPAVLVFFWGFGAMLNSYNTAVLKVQRAVLIKSQVLARQTAFETSSDSQ